MAQHVSPVRRPSFVKEPLPARSEFACTADWWEALSAVQRRDYIEREGCPPIGAMRAWPGPQDPGFGNG